MLQPPETSVIAETENYVRMVESMQGRKILDNLDPKLAGFPSEPSAGSESAGLPLVTSEPDMFPCLLIMAGSLLAAAKVEDFERC